MKPSYSCLLLCLLIFFLCISPVARSDVPLYNFCRRDATYTANSAFQANLDHVLSFLPSAAAPSGFAFTTVGREGPDQVHGLALCRGDVSSADCLNCLKNATKDIITKCPHGAGSTIWYDGCMLRYNNNSFFSVLNNPLFRKCIPNQTEVTELQRFDYLLKQLMDTLTSTAAQSPQMFAFGEVNFTESNKIYGMAQCTRDLYSVDCYSCLGNFEGTILSCCDGKQGGKVFGRNCAIRYELYPFYNVSAVQNVAVPNAAAPPPEAIATTQSRTSSNPVRCEQLDWVIRYKIIEGICRGLLYLHEDSRLKIVHRDLKASNILLDAFMTPKISDFGLAKLFDVDTSEGNTSRIVGTYGYMAPEYVSHGHFSTKSDVFSYGVLVLEIVTGRRNAASQETVYSESVLSYVWKHWSQGTAHEVLDPNLAGRCRSQDVLRCIHIGLLCVQEDPSNRPSMASVVLMLSSLSFTLPAPSANDVSISELGPR